MKESTEQGLRKPSLITASAVNCGGSKGYYIIPIEANQTII